MIHVFMKGRIGDEQRLQKQVLKRAEREELEAEFYKQYQNDAFENGGIVARVDVGLNEDVPIIHYIWSAFDYDET